MRTAGAAASSASNLRGALWVAAALLFAFQWLHASHRLVDDAFISLRYARHLAEGHGLVFNPGEAVEGYTNFLWVLLGALALRLSADPLVWLRSASLLAALGALVVVQRMARGEPAGRPSAWLAAPLWLLPLPAFAYWASSGMETMAFAALFAAALWLRLREGREERWRGSALVFLLLALLRPEGALCFALALVVVGVRDRQQSGRWPLGRALADAGVFALGFGAYTLWRLDTYGSLLPNTFHARVTGGAKLWRDGLLDLAGFALTYPVFALVALVAPLVFGALGRQRGSETAATALAVWALVVGWIAYVVAVGGDFMPFERFFLPVLPLLAVLTVWTLAAALPAARGAARAAALLLALHVGAGLLRADTFQAFVLHRMTDVGLRAGEHLAERFEPDTWIAVNAAGAVAWASRLPTIDMLGLTDPVVARAPASGAAALRTGHRRGSGSYVLARRPRVVFWQNTAGHPEPLYGGDFQLAADPWFRFFYGLERVSLPVEERGGRRVLAWFVGEPLHDERSRLLLAADLGLRFEMAEVPLVHTVAYEAPVEVRYFVLRPGLEPLWPLREAAGDDLGLFLREVAARWQEEARRRDVSAAPADGDRAQAVERMLSGARDQLRQGKRLSARILLDVARQRSAALPSAPLHEASADLALALGDLPLAVEAQQQALRCDPANAAIAKRLEELLRAPWPGA